MLPILGAVAASSLLGGGKSKGASNPLASALGPLGMAQGAMDIAGGSKNKDAGQIVGGSLNTALGALSSIFG
ncbi:MAG: hypothetical protein K2X01_02515 [Cyanobacteria bacterium]|nr:hypothetical protein [Cyanobacteriota bacterium]